MAVIFYIKRGDTAPAIQQTLLDGNGNPVNLTGATVRFHMLNQYRVAPVLVVNAAATIAAPATSGVVSYAWQAADVANAGTFLAEWEVTFSDATIETFPNNDNVVVNIGADLQNP